ncbi:MULTISPECIES: hypothetical protein [Leisingera]|jgi:hypothetical protein|uniref:Flp pilus assembly protein, pilin Flp n=1 Tax=Leisingera aquaemixtae TaxID=1396826 RepID=A0A0P1H512_9RHOB|nr:MULTISPECIES: hypothetical protein [Leisingera]UWQ23871.1 hypothetical protein K3553_12920 [Leisingera aquaemixtae]UWQ36390.1 hypothetical protein K3552_12845 [Leisingera aquaemixtae]UWQ40500.1 hypothetical protein K3718_13170 [Leisingera aquaemixtae]UWQ44754.1 hypothetical protein K3719_13255 [Leisingera aquaemixtae]CUH97926.1 hypothetical protein PHA8399_00029 [Leisingera aquaemixtae]
MKKLRLYIASDDGAVSVDWVVLCAAIVGMAAMIAAAMEDGALGAAQAIAAFMSNWSFS